LSRRPHADLADYQRILVIKLGALGDFVQAMRAMAEIRRAHPIAKITLLTTPPFTAFATASGLFDAVQTDGRPKGLEATAALFARLRRARYERVYDLQTSSRSRSYFYALLPFPPEWSGISLGASHRHRNRERDRMQTLDRLWDQLRDAGVVPALPPGQAPGPDLSWAARAVGGRTAAVRFSVKKPYALLAPGASPGRPKKRWPVDRFAELARELAAQGLTPVVVGGPQEEELGQAIKAAAPSTIVLAGRTSLADLAGLGAGAALMVGNDTGPTYLAAFAGAPSVVLFSSESDPALCAPRTQRLSVLQKDDLGDLPAAEVSNACRLMLSGA
jgi:ADP-heptose:LPS heptosyltransferase